jgi:hypothetical protein
MKDDLMVLDTVELLINLEGDTVWVNSEKGCVLRIQNIKKIYLVDERVTKGE